MSALQKMSDKLPRSRYHIEQFRHWFRNTLGAGKVSLRAPLVVALSRKVSVMSRKVSVMSRKDSGTGKDFTIHRVKNLRKGLKIKLLYTDASPPAGVHTMAN